VLRLPVLHVGRVQVLGQKEPAWRREGNDGMSGQTGGEDREAEGENSCGGMWGDRMRCVAYQ
jgi:hypothetical protein